MGRYHSPTWKGGPQQKVSRPRQRDGKHEDGTPRWKPQWVRFIEEVGYDEANYNAAGTKHTDWPTVKHVVKVRRQRRGASSYAYMPQLDSGSAVLDAVGPCEKCGALQTRTVEWQTFEVDADRIRRAIEWAQKHIEELDAATWQAWQACEWPGPGWRRKRSREGGPGVFTKGTSTASAAYARFCHLDAKLAQAIEAVERLEVKMHAKPETYAVEGAGLPQRAPDLPA